MNNLYCLVGRIVNDPTIEKDEKRSVITIAVQRGFKNEEGIYETDFIPVVMWKGIAENVIEYCRKGDLVGVKGRIESIKMASGNVIELVADKVSFLSSRKED